MYRHPNFKVWSTLDNTIAPSMYRKEDDFIEDKYTVLLGTILTGGNRFIALIYQFKMLEDQVNFAFMRLSACSKI